MTNKSKQDNREVARQAFRQATGDLEPDVSRIVDAVPAILAEARRRRALDKRRDPISAVVPLARWAIPRLAAAAAALVLLASFVGFRETPDTDNVLTGLDAYILTGEISDGVSNILLEAITEEGNDSG